MVGGCLERRTEKDFEATFGLRGLEMSAWASQWEVALGVPVWPRLAVHRGTLTKPVSVIFFVPSQWV